ncbi:hypothetical protein HMPREF0262_01688 [Clostridium sp. ATCC 29733]|nr:hypothetical protein HMPREF0262_01688 [Clostridium sp. ATCC 29733]
MPGGPLNKNSGIFGAVPGAWCRCVGRRENEGCRSLKEAPVEELSTAGQMLSFYRREGAAGEVKSSFSIPCPGGCKVAGFCPAVEGRDWSDGGQKM